MNLFIPPEGAMQFERTSQPESAVVPIGDVPFYWVSPESDPLPGSTCGCKKVYPVIVAGLPEPWKTKAGEVLRRKPHVRPIVCKCNGRIIE